MKTFLGLVLLVGCSTPKVATQDAGNGTGGSGTPVLTSLPQSGTRIKVQYLKSSDGSLAPYGYFDTQLDAGCYWAQTPDAGYRCVTASWPLVDPTPFAQAELVTD